MIVNDSTDVWRDDEVELAFYAVYDGNPAGGDTHQFTVNADGRVTDFGVPNPPIEAMAAIVPGGWDVEVRIPASTLYGFYNQPGRGRGFLVQPRPARRRRWRQLGQLSDLAGHGYDRRRRLRRDVPHHRGRLHPANADAYRYNVANRDRDPNAHADPHGNSYGHGNAGWRA